MVANGVLSQTSVKWLEGISKSKSHVVDEVTSPCFTRSALGLVTSSTTKIVGCVGGNRDRDRSGDLGGI